MIAEDLRSVIDGSVAVVRKRLSAAGMPEGVRAGAIAGSGLAGIADSMNKALEIGYGDLPGWPLPSVRGHAGKLLIGELGGVRTAVASGRTHMYEGVPRHQLAFGVRLMRALGAEAVVVTNAAGGLRDDLEPGDLMIIEDHIYLPGLAGESPLVGPNDDDLGERFPDMRGAYDPRLRRIAMDSARKEGFRASEGIYAMVGGPSYETPAEARMLRMLGADAVGMSTAPEVVAARHAKMRVLGVSVITNRVAMEIEDRREAELTTGRDVAASKPSAAYAPEADLHAEVEAVGAAAAPRLGKVLEAVIGQGL